MTADQGGFGKGQDASFTNNLVFGAQVVDNPSGTIIRSLGIGGMSPIVTC
jgi:hypothetical protein